MYSIKLDWKEFSVSLLAVEAWINSNVGDFYVGNSADSALTLWFSEELSTEDAESVTTYWAGLTEESDEAVNYVSNSAIKSTIDALRVGLVSKTWDQMSVAERKIATNQAPTLAELGL